ncbi:helix-turn-helix transcriptional regulator [Gordonia hydrophobica]|uniref:LuxR C-terminal-related transcriptional regulator n=1 Tax=Gordonia hydrophobica TaxID=40516 RepID=A0ABZ2U3T9_9ACTN|nr:LuxR C-terminal-related transcriptional regulator [Gordonia hydrophobica]MBM7367979.1 DNA-binding CsgD family transcriptional regulator [Gordonia hydrophobica]
MARLYESPAEDGRVLARALDAFRQRTSMDMVFGGPVRRGSVAMEITALNGARTRSAANLVVHKGEGLGGKALVLGRPVMVADYVTAEGITHIYDHAVRPEALQTLTALPIVVERAPRLLIYLGARAQVSLGDRWFDTFSPIVRRIERDLAVDDEVQRRLSLLQQANGYPALTRGDLFDIARELNDLADAIDDESVKARLQAVGDRFAPSVAPDRSTVQPLLRPREIDVLREVSRGLSNREVADALGLLPNTVKSYLKNAMRKLHVSNRVQAITAAREQGLI